MADTKGKARKSPFPSLKKVLAGLAVLGLLPILLCAGIFGPCWSAWLLDGIYVRECPAGSVRPTVELEASGLGRGQLDDGGGSVDVRVWGSYAVGKVQSPRNAAVRRFSPELELVFPDGSTQPLTGLDWESTYVSGQRAQVRLPDVPDGDYKLRAKVQSPAGEAVVEAPLRLYAPALVHVLTDSPIYKPGQQIRFRSVVLRERGLNPMEGRPGMWKVYDPQGELVLEERAKAGAYGIAASSFPLDDEAPEGAWRVVYESGEDRDEVAVEVKPFELPRLTVEVNPDAPSLHAGDLARFSGTARYTSGAPVADAPVVVTLSAPGGGWPPPLSWLEPRTLRTDRDGRFEVDLGAVPADLVGSVRVSISAMVTDPTGEVVYGGGALTLAQDRIAATTVTELWDGLVSSTNNRMFVRVTTAAGATMPGAEIRLKRAWDAKDPGLTAVADADGVARFQVDPGEPVTIVSPVMPRRKRPRAEQEVVSIDNAIDRLTGAALDVDGQKTLDAWKAALRPCAQYAVGGSISTVAGVLISGGGSVRQVMAEGPPGLDGCVEAVLSRQSAFGGRDRLWGLNLTFDDPQTPSLSASVDLVVGSQEGIDGALSERLAGLRGCAAGVQEGGEVPLQWIWRQRAGGRAVDFTAIPYDGATSVPESVGRCAEQAFRGDLLDEPAEADAMGILTISVDVPSDPSDAPQQPQTRQGFEYEVVAVKDGQEVGTTKVFLNPGYIPDLRLRFSEVLVNPGDTVDLLALRGQSFSGSFPENMYLTQGGQSIQKFAFDRERRKGSFTVPAGTSGYATVEWSGARAILYIRPQATLSLSVRAAEKDGASTFRPGETATLLIESRGKDGPVQAGVTLSGVDSTLGTLAALPGPDGFARVTVQAKAEPPAFGMLDAQALQTGQIQGDNAAQATILRINTLPVSPPDLEQVSTRAAGVLEVDGDMADAFFTLHAKVRDRVRRWETEAPEGEVMTPKKMVALWEEVLATNPTEDPWGRPLHLTLLPPDVLLLTDPRQMVSDGARLPEDIENWPAFVSREAP